MTGVARMRISLSRRRHRTAEETTSTAPEDTAANAPEGAAQPVAHEAGPTAPDTPLEPVPQEPLEPATDDVAATASEVAEPPRQPKRRTTRFAYRNELIGLALLLAIVAVIPMGRTRTAYVLGTVQGATLLLHAAAVVLVYRANKFVNFGQLGFVAVAGYLYTSLVQGRFLLNTARTFCGCISREPGSVALLVNFVLAVALSIALTAFVAWAVYGTVLRRFRRSPRIMLTLVTVFVGQILASSRSTIQRFLIPTDLENEEAIGRVTARSTRPPGDFEWRIGDLATVRLGDVLIVLAAAVAVVGLTLYLRKSRTGIAIRASAESPARAGTLGVDVQAVTGRVWLTAGLLAGVVGVVGSFGASVQVSDSGVIPASSLAMILAVAVMARFHSLLMAAAAAFVIGALHTAIAYQYLSTAPFDVALVFLIGALLLLQRSRSSRAERDDFSGYEVTREVRPIPREMRGLPQVRTWVRSTAVLGSAVVLGLPWLLSSSTTTLFTVYAIYMIVGLSLLVLTGWGGQVSLGQFGFAAVGAWTAAVSDLPFPFALLLAGVVGALVSVVVGVPALKLRGLNLAISTLAFAVSARALLIDDRYLGDWLPEELDRPSVLGMDFDDSRVFYYFAVIMVVLSCVAVAGLRRSRFGRVLIGLRANEAAAQSFGINVLAVRLGAFAVSGFLAAFAGGLFAFHQRAVTPRSFAADASIEMFMFAVIGGLGGIAGPVLGFTYMSLLTLMSENPLLRYTGAGTGAILLLMVAPGGFAEVVYKIRDASLRRLAVRLRLDVPSLLGDRLGGGTTERVRLDEKRGRAADSAPGIVYELRGQWALDRYAGGHDTGERVGRKEPVS